MITKKKETPIEKIIVGVIILVVGGLILTWLSGSFNSGPQPPTPTKQEEAISADQGRG